MLVTSSVELRKSQPVAVPVLAGVHGQNDDLEPGATLAAVQSGRRTTPGAIRTKRAAARRPPQSVAARDCHLDEAQTATLLAQANKLAATGLRVLAVARSTEPVDAPPIHPHDVPFSFLGLVGLEDALRDDVKAAIASCQRAQVKVLMLTGDHKETARSIAVQAGLEPGEVITGAEIESLTDEALAAALKKTSVVARAVPAHKLRIVKALQLSGAVVGMTGDGVNDAPALKAADVGIAMGKRGTEVAREASSLVLVDDTFGSIVSAIRVGRRIFDNLRKATSYIVSVHLPLAGMAIVPALLGWGLRWRSQDSWRARHAERETSCSACAEPSGAGGPARRRWRIVSGLSGWTGARSL